jgi:tRNA pseudouridine(38-40) synthase
MRFKLTIEYAGTRYSGWQVQKNARTVQGELERAIAEVAGTREFELYGSGRTDAGVHALAQVAHLDLVTSVPPDTLMRRINDQLPSDINISAFRKSGTLSTPVTALARAPISTRSRVDGPRLPSRSSGGSRTISTSRECVSSASVS